ncbi:hypothetical protein B11531_07670 [Campylobacter jejuni]|nr:hypothetical protein B11531_07670 [Campylobacter jejuni]
MQRKQSRRILKTKKEKTKLSHNFKKTQLKLNKIYEKSSNIKKDSYHKITSKLIQEFDLLAVEDLQIKNMCKRAKLKNIKAKSGLNKSILNTSFYQFSQYLEYKAKHNGKFFIKVNPQAKLVVYVEISKKILCLKIECIFVKNVAILYIEILMLQIIS